MSFNRLAYDACAYNKELQQSVDPLQYNLFLGKYENNIQCPVGDHTNNLPLGVRATDENELLGLTRPFSRCPEKKYNPNSGYKGANFSPAKMCENIYHITPTNLVKPKTNMLNENNLGVNFCSKN